MKKRKKRKKTNIVSHAHFLVVWGANYSQVFNIATTIRRMIIIIIILYRILVLRMLSSLCLREVVVEMITRVVVIVEMLLLEVGGEEEVQRPNYRRRNNNNRHYHLYDDHSLQEQVVGLLLQYDAHCPLEVDDDIINNNNNLVVIEVSGKDLYHLVEELLGLIIQLIPTTSAVLAVVVRGN